MVRWMVKMGATFPLEDFVENRLVNPSHHKGVCLLGSFQYQYLASLRGLVHPSLGRQAVQAVAAGWLEQITERPSELQWFGSMIQSSSFFMNLQLPMLSLDG